MRAVTLMPPVSGHPRFDVSKFYVEVAWEKDDSHEPERNSYDDEHEDGQRGKQAEEEEGASKEAVDGWEGLKQAALQLLRIIVEVLL